MHHSRNGSRLRKLDLSRAGVAVDAGTSRFAEPITPSARSAELATYHPLGSTEKPQAYARFPLQSSKSGVNQSSPVSQKQLSAKGATSLSSIIERLRASRKLTKIKENEDEARRRLLAPNDHVEMPQDAEDIYQRRVEKKIVVPPNSPRSTTTFGGSKPNTPHPDSFPIEPAFVFTLDDSSSEIAEFATILSDGQIVPADIDTDESFEGPECRCSLASPRLHPELKVRNIFGVEVDRSDSWNHFDDGYCAAAAEARYASFLEIDD